MLNETENKIRIEGILSEIDLAPKTFKKNGSDVSAIGGSIKIRVTQTIDNVETDLEIPVHMFASEYTNKGTPNPAYESIHKVMTEFSSIAAVGLDNADRIRITSAKVAMNEYYGQNGNLISFPRITASFVQKIRKEDCKPEASFSLVFVIGQAGYETDKDGVETNKYKINAIVPQYGGKVDIVPLYATNKGVIDAVSNYWSVGDTVKASGKLNFTSRTEVHKVSVDFGDATEETRTVSVSELLITGGSSTPMEGEFAINSSDIEVALADRKARLAAAKDKGTVGKAPAQSNNNKFKDLGF